MVDSTDLALIATVVQTIVITFTLVVFIFQFRSQEKAIKESAYQNVLGRYNEYVMSSSGTDDKLLAQLFMGSGKNLTPEDIAATRRMMVAYGIIEEAYELYEKGWIDKEAWDQWGEWLKALCRHPRFADLHSAAAGMFDKGFQDYVTKILKESGDIKSKDA